MEFWGVEVKAGEPLKVKAEDHIIVHLSQAALGEFKGKGTETAILHVNVDGQKLVLGTLSSDKCPQIPFDLVFEKDFELSHNWKNGSVFFVGYRADQHDDSESLSDVEFESDSDEEEEVPPAVAIENGKPEVKAEKSKAVVADKAKAAKPDSKVKDAKPAIDDSDDTDEDDSEEDDSDDEDMLQAGDEDDSSDEDDDDEDSSDEEEEEKTPTPKKAKENKKRPAEAAAKTPVAEKKAKLVTPQKSGGDGKKGNAHTATPHPSKGGKTNEKNKGTPKSGGSVACKACPKTFNSEAAMQSHSKAKHSDGK